MLDGTRSVLSSVVNSQIELHARFGGVVPELASRAHIVAIEPVIREALERAGASIGDIAGFAATRGPGLTGSLLVALEAAKGAALALDRPLEGVHHLEGHLMAPFLGVAAGFDAPDWPFVALLVSGGHTSLVRCDAPGVYTELGRTLDDAAGEAFDKLSKQLGLGYPGGALIDRLAEGGDASRFALPRPLLKRVGHDFSFSGLKTATSLTMTRLGALTEVDVRDLAASFRAAVVDVLVARLLGAARHERIERVVVSGGVACNVLLRSRLLESCGAAGLGVSVPAASLCTDNAAMIGAAGYARLHGRVRSGGGFDAAGLDARSTWGLGELRPADG